MYRSRSELILDATRRFLEKTMPPTSLEFFIQRYLLGKVKPTQESERIVSELFKKVQTDTTWMKHFGKTPEEVMKTLRRRLM